MVDYNLLAPDDLNEILKRPLDKVLSTKEVDRLEKALYNYDYYSGLQHTDAMGRLVRASELDRPDGYSYDPARFETNYFKAFIKRKARWQMAGAHGIEVIPKDEEDSTSIEEAKKYEKLLATLWEENQMDAKKMALARDRMIGGKIACKLAYNPATGRLHWIWHKAYEVFPLYSEDGFDTLEGYDIIVQKEDEESEGQTLYYVQHFRLEDEVCYLEELVYDDQLKVREVIQPKASLGIDFVPVVTFDVEMLDRDGEYFDDLKDMEILTSQLNSMMEDATDALAFEMFGITKVTNAREGTAAQLEIAPGAVVEIQSAIDGVQADMGVVEYGFKWKEAYKDQYNRIKSALHELSGLPQIVPQELNFGGMNDRALQVLYQDVIQETQEHWLSWEVGFNELFEKSLWYLKARSDTRKFRYDKQLVNNLEDIQTTKVNFILPLPDDRENLIDLLQKEVDYGFESVRGAQKRAGVVDVDRKFAEIQEEREMLRQSEDPYNMTSEVETLADEIEPEVEDLPQE